MSNHIEMQAKTVTLGSDSAEVEFTFSDTVQQYAAGLVGFYLAYESGNFHYVKNMQVKISGGSTENNSLTLTVQIAMTDGAENTQGTSICTVTVGVVAFVGDNTDNQILLYDGSTAIPSGNSDNLSDVANRPTSTVAGGATMLGFDLSYADGHWVQEVSASASADTSDYTVSVQASMHDASGNSSSQGTQTVTPGMIAAEKVSGSATPPLLAFAPTSVVGGIQNQSVSMPYHVDQYIAFINGFTLSYGDTDHEVACVQAQVTNQPDSFDSNSPSIDNVTVDTTARIADNNGNNIDTGSSSIDVFVVGRVVQPSSD